MSQGNANPSQYFSADYFRARDRFRLAARKRGFQVETYLLAAGEPWAQDLSIDVALRRTPGARGLLLITSGLHGTEGFLGSAIQLALIETGSEPLGDLVLVHALNPYGFARLRRANEENVDLNRNFLLRCEEGTCRPAPDEDYQGCPRLYARLDPLLNPRRPPRRFDPWLPRAVWTLMRYGRPALRQAIAGGQFEFPKGLFFGGKGPSRSQQMVTHQLSRWLAGAERILHFDIHTGLGKWGELRLLLEEPLQTSVGQALAEEVGPAIVSLPTAGQGDYYTSRGDFGTFCRALVSAQVLDSFCAEFGTYPALTVLSALRAENQAHHWGHPDASATHAAKRRLCEVFCPADTVWRQMVVSKGVEMIHRAAAILGRAS